MINFGTKPFLFNLKFTSGSVQLFQYRSLNHPQTLAPILDYLPNALWNSQFFFRGEDRASWQRVVTGPSSWEYVTTPQDPHDLHLTERSTGVGWCSGDFSWTQFYPSSEWEPALHFLKANGVEHGSGRHVVTRHSGIFRQDSTELDDRAKFSCLSPRQILEVVEDTIQFPNLVTRVHTPDGGDKFVLTGHFGSQLGESSVHHTPCFSVRAIFKNQIFLSAYPVVSQGY